jgi:hypothetical protein
MGGRISGESPREENAIVGNRRAGALWLYQDKSVGEAVAATASAVGHTSEQQLTV